jgi:hypothetical protein
MEVSDARKLKALEGSSRSRRSMREALGKNGRRFRALVIVDDFTRECLAVVWIHRCRANGSSENWMRSSVLAASRS